MTAASSASAAPDPGLAGERGLERRGERRVFWWLVAACSYLGLNVFAREAHPHADDAFIYFRVAANVLAGHGPVFNVGDAHMPVTSPLWLHLLVAGKLLAPQLALPQIAKLLSVLCLAGASVFAALLFRRHLGVWAALAPLGVVFNRVLFTSAGLEIPLAYLAVLATMWAHQERRSPYLVGCLLGLAYLSRGECVLVGAVMAAMHAREIQVGRTGARSALRYLVLVALAAAVIALAWHTYSFARLGVWLPETLKAKMLQGEAGATTLYSERLWQRLGTAANGRGLVLVLLGAWWLFPKLPMLFAWPAVHYVAYSALGVAFYTWYYYDFELVVSFSALFGIVLVVQGALAAWRYVGERWAAHALVRGAGTVLILAAAPALALRPYTQVQTVTPSALLVPRPSAFVAWDESAFKARERIYAKAAEWVNAQTVPAAERVIFIKEIGVLAYYCPDFEVRDSAGLASPLDEPGDILDDDRQVHRYRPKFYFQRVGPKYLKHTLAPAPEKRVFSAPGEEPLRFLLTHTVMLTENRIGGYWYVREG